MQLIKTKVPYTVKIVAATEAGVSAIQRQGLPISFTYSQITSAGTIQGKYKIAC